MSAIFARVGALARALARVVVLAVARVFVRFARQAVVAVVLALTRDLDRARAGDLDRTEALARASARIFDRLNDLDFAIGLARIAALILEHAPVGPSASDRANARALVGDLDGALARASARAEAAARAQALDPVKALDPAEFLDRFGAIVRDLAGDLAPDSRGQDGAKRVAPSAAGILAAAIRLLPAADC